MYVYSNPLVCLSVCQSVYQFDFKDSYGQIVSVIAQHKDMVNEKYTTVKIGDRVERFDGPLSNLLL